MPWSACLRMIKGYFDGIPREYQMDTGLVVHRWEVLYVHRFADLRAHYGDIFPRRVRRLQLVHSCLGDRPFIWDGRESFPYMEDLVDNRF